LVKGAAFYASPRVSPDGNNLLWIDWNHPNMPWDHTRLWVADIGDKFELDNPLRVAGDIVEAVVQPEWFGGEIRFVSDRNGWWNLYQTIIGKDSAHLLFEEEKEFARAPWVFALNSYANLANGNIIGFTEAQGRHQMYLLDTRSNTKTDILPQFNNIESITTQANVAWFIAGSETANQSVWKYDTETKSLTSISDIKQESSEYVISTANSISFPTTHKQIAHANLYLPESSSKNLPPLLVKCHGGPSGVALKGLDWKIQYWTSRGFAVLDVNYRGSTGFGREYRNSLYGHWGEYDVDDCLAGIEYLIERKLVDENKIVITGGSAGGYTVLRALIVSDVFAAGTSYYGVADLKTLVGDDHKFESRYLETCIAPFATHPERYEELSPINHVEKISSPMLFFQGLKDKVVQPNQTSGVVEKLRQKGNVVEMVEFPDEGHGFRQAESIITSLETEYAFYMKVFNN
jgi:dipeptidyl aminopeptidase/acylaminoacyl peptidase